MERPYFGEFQAQASSRAGRAGFGGGNAVAKLHKVIVI
jgi:hypothetical protein